MDTLDGVLGAVLDRVEDLANDVGRPADGEVGVGEAAFRRTLFAFWLRNFSSSSEEVASEFFALKSILIATESKLLRELPKEGARLIPGAQNDDPANVSERRTRREEITTGWSESLESDDIDRRILEGLASEIPELSVEELGVEGFREREPREGEGERP